MHSYTTDVEKTNIYAVIAFLSVVAALGLSIFFKSIKLEVPWLIDAPSIIGFYGIFYRIFDKYLWKSAKLTNTPNLSGSWEGKIITSYDKHTNDYPATLSIKQTWSHISIVLTTDNSRSESSVAMISTKNPDGAKVQYAYENKPRHNAKSTMHAHSGTADLSLSTRDNIQILEGDYYTGRDRRNHGILHFEKILNQIS
jgi:hypothetical protein